MADVHELSPHLRRLMERDQAALDAGALLKSATGIIKACEHNARVLLTAAPHYAGLHFDEFLSRMRVDDRDWIDADDLEAVCWLQSAHGVSAFTLSQARNAARALAHSRRRDSLRQFIEALPAWDAIHRIEHAFIDAWGAPGTPMVRAASRSFFVALIARGLHPGSQVDTLWTFEGPQGSYKSRSLRALGGSLHAEISAAIGTTDFQRELRGIWIAEMSELDSLRGREASTIKRLLSAPSDRFVEKYQVHAQCYPRRAVAVATTNEASYWQDATGARRLVPIACGDIRVDLIAANRLQWFAEARHLHAGGATWWEFPGAIADEQDARQQVDPWEDLLRGYLTHGKRGGMDGMSVFPWPGGWISSADILRDWLQLSPHQQGRASGVRLGHVMRRLGFQPERRGKERERGWSADTQPGTQPEVSA